MCIYSTEYQRLVDDYFPCLRAVAIRVSLVALADTVAQEFQRRTRHKAFADGDRLGTAAKSGR